MIKIFLLLIFNIVFLYYFLSNIVIVIAYLDKQPQHNFRFVFEQNLTKL